MRRQHPAHLGPNAASTDPLLPSTHRQASKKAAAPLSSQPQLALEVPLGSGRGAGSGLPRLPFDAGRAAGRRVQGCCPDPCGCNALRSGAPLPAHQTALTLPSLPLPARHLQPTTTWTPPAAAASWHSEAAPSVLQRASKRSLNRMQLVSSVPNSLCSLGGTPRCRSLCCPSWAPAALLLAFPLHPSFAAVSVPAAAVVMPFKVTVQSV